MTSDRPDYKRREAMEKRLREMFAAADGEYLKFERVESRWSNRPDMHALITLEKLFPGTKDLIAGATHDEFYLEIEPWKLGELATQELITDLHRCGLRYSEKVGLCFFA